MPNSTENVGGTRDKCSELLIISKTVPYTREYILRRVAAIQKRARQHYEPGRQDRSWPWVWRYHILPVYSISFRTFERYMAIDVEKELEKLRGPPSCGVLFGK